MYVRAIASRCAATSELEQIERSDCTSGPVAGYLSLGAPVWFLLGSAHHIVAFVIAYKPVFASPPALANRCCACTRSVVHQAALPSATSHKTYEMI